MAGAEAHCFRTLPGARPPIAASSCRCMMLAPSCRRRIDELPASPAMLAEVPLAGLSFVNAVVWDFAGI